jgi:hypothetical protein
MLTRHTTTLGLPDCLQASNRKNDYPSPMDWELACFGRGGLLATVAHELRDPLAAILYALQAIADRGDGNSATRGAEFVVRLPACRENADGPSRIDSAH